MKDKINSININGKLDREKLFNLFKTHSSKINKEISEKIDIFIHNKDFFEFYSNNDIKKLLYIFKLKISEDNDIPFSSFRSDIDQYISSISQIFLSIKLFFKIQDILTKIVVKAKNNLSKLKYENKIDNYNHDYLFLYLESLIKISEKPLKFYSSASTLFTFNFSSGDNPKKLLIRKLSNEYKFNYFSNSEIESDENNSPSTPKFELELDKEFENQEKKNTNSENSFIKKSSVLTFSNYVFFKESFTQQNVKSIITNQNEKNTYTKGNMLQIENSNKHYDNTNQLSKTCHIINNNTNLYINLLEMITKLYKKGLINSEEKLKLKQLVIRKSTKVENFYYTIFKNSKTDKKVIEDEVKKMIN